MNGGGGGLCAGPLPSLEGRLQPPTPEFLWKAVFIPPSSPGGLARGPDGEELAREASSLRAYIKEKLWCDTQGCFADRRLRPTAGFPGGGELSKTRSVGAYWTLVSGLAASMEEDQLERFLSALDDPALFNRPSRVPSLSADHPNYDPGGGYWLGSVWPPTTYVSFLRLCARRVCRGSLCTDPFL